MFDRCYLCCNITARVHKRLDCIFVYFSGVEIQQVIRPWGEDDCFWNCTGLFCRLSREDRMGE